MPRRPPDDYVARYGARHRAPMTRALTVVGDVLYVGGPLLGLVLRRTRVAVAGLVAGAAVTATAHLFQPGTLVDELRATIRHPLWAARAELGRLRRARHG